MAIKVLLDMAPVKNEAHNCEQEEESVEENVHLVQAILWKYHCFMTPTFPLIITSLYPIFFPSLPVC